jgi:hypothetical protein
MNHRVLFRRALFLVGLYALLLAHAWTLSGGLIDDAYITLCFARNLIENGQWGMIPGHAINTATSPLNVWLLAVGGLIVGDPRRAVVALTALQWLALILLLRRLGRRADRPGFFPLAASAALLFNPLLLSTIGMESWLVVLLLTAALVCLAERRWTALGLTLAALILARIDCGVALPVFLAFAPDWATRRRVLAAAIAPLIPWYLFSWIVLGAMLPESIFIKSIQGSWDGATFANGLALYWRRYPTALAASFVAAVGCVGLAPRGGPGAPERRPAFVLLAVAALHAALFCLRGVPPYHWYYAPQVAALAIAWAFGLSRLAASRWRAVAGFAWGIAALPVALWGAWLAGEEMLPPAEPPIHSNWATQEEYRVAGEWLRENVAPGDAIVGVPEVGALTYYSRRELLSEFSDRVVLLGLAYEQIPPSGFLARLWVLNGMWRGPVVADANPVYTIEYRPDAAPPQPWEVHRWLYHSRWRGHGKMILIRGK